MFLPSMSITRFSVTDEGYAMPPMHEIASLVSGIPDMMLLRPKSVVNLSVTAHDRESVLGRRSKGLLSSHHRLQFQVPESSELHLQVL